MYKDLFKSTYDNVMRVLGNGSTVVIQIKEQEYLTLKKKPLNSLKYTATWTKKDTIVDYKTIWYQDLQKILRELDPFNFKTLKDIKKDIESNLIKIDFKTKKVM